MLATACRYNTHNPEPEGIRQKGGKNGHTYHTINHNSRCAYLACAYRVDGLEGGEEMTHTQRAQQNLMLDIKRLYTDFTEETGLVIESVRIDTFKSLDENGLCVTAVYQPTSVTYDAIMRGDA